MNIYLYGPPGSGKSTLGQALAQALELPFVDLDLEIEQQAGQSIPAIFAAEGEAGFRRRELEALSQFASAERPPAVIALGGGALLNPQVRQVAEDSGQVLCLQAGMETLLARLQTESEGRPLLAGDPAARLARLLADRAAHYDSFALRLDTSNLPPEAMIWPAQRLLGAFRVRGMGQPYDVRVESGGLARLGRHLRARGLKGPVALVSDRNVGALYQAAVVRGLEEAGYTVSTHCIEPGEAHKNIQTIMGMWDFFIRAGVERGSTVVALGGGVVGDMTGFAAATFLRGVPWVNVPTSLLAMVDASLGGKTGIDLPQAKNLVGAFYPPRLVLADPRLLETLPERELRGGMAEVLKHGIIADPDLFALCAGGLAQVKAQMARVVVQAMAVKLKVIEEDPYEKGRRQALNLGHTIGHGVELTSEFSLSHGEAVAIGTVAAARLAEHVGLARAGLADQIRAALSGLGLPVEIPPDLPPERVVQATLLDKKRAAGQVRFALPVNIGEVRVGMAVADWAEWLEGQFHQPGQRREL